MAEETKKLEIRHHITNAVLWTGQAKDLRGAVEQAVSARAYLAGANLVGANLAGAYLAGAYLADAYLAGANLAGANLADANLVGAKGLNPHRVQTLLMLKEQPGKIRAYKLVTSDFRSPIHGYQIQYAIGKQSECVNPDTDTNELCGAGIHVATLDWVMREWREGHRILVVEFEAADIACIPTASDGKFRLYRCTPVAEKDLVEIGLVPSPEKIVARSAAGCAG